MIPLVNESEIKLTNASPSSTTSPTKENDDSSIFGENSDDEKTLEKNLEILNQEFQSAKDEQGFFGNVWNGFKNFTGLGLSSNDVENSIEDYKNGKITFEEALNTIESYQNKQSSMVDMAANVVSGVVTGAITIFSGGTLTLVGVAAGAAIGGGVKAGIKTLDRATNDVENDALDIKQIAKDTITGAVDGAVNVATAGMIKGATAGNTIRQATIQGFKTGALSGSISGAASGAASYSAEVLTEDDKDFDLSEFLKLTSQNAIAGGVMGGVLGGVSQGISQKNLNSKAILADECLENTETSNVTNTSKTSDKKVKIAHNEKLSQITDPSKQTNEYINNYNYNNPNKEIAGDFLEITTKDLEELSPKAQELAEIFDSQLDETTQQVNNAFSDKTDIEMITSRAKSQNSTFAKLAKKDIKGDLKNLDFDTCYDTVKDALGVRIQMKSLTTEDTREIVENILRENNINATMEDFVKYLQNPEALDATTLQAISDVEDSILNTLKTKQTESTVKQLIKGIENGSIDISELSNYGDDLSSYFTDVQIHDISEAYVKHARAIGSNDVFEFTNNRKVAYQGEDDIGNYGDLSPMDSDLVKQSQKSAIKESGYATSQMDAKYKMADGTTAHYELQIRGTEVNAFGDVEHIPYDIRTGKIFYTDPKYSDIYSIIKNMSSENFGSYNEYLTAVYKTLRMRELGILPADSALPELSSYLKDFSQESLSKLDWDGLKTIALKSK